MAKSIIQRIDRNLALRLREARKEVGLSTRAVSEKLPRGLVVSHASIAAYENGTTSPSIDVLGGLATVYQRPLNWFLEDRDSLSGFRYRNLRSRVSLSEQRVFEAQAGKWAEAYFKLEKYLSDTERRQLACEVNRETTPHELAEKIRKDILQLDDDQPIQNMVDVLESFSAWALELKAGFGTDGAAARHGDETVVLINTNVTSECVRWNAAHELAHHLYAECKQDLGWTDGEVEKRAYLFAARLLLPESQLNAAFAGKSFLRLIQFRERFGVSLSAMIHMAEKDGIINSTTSRWLLSEMIKRGWKNNEPGFILRDRAIGFEMMLEAATQTKQITWADAERITGIREKELRERLLNAASPEWVQEERRDVPTLKFPPSSER